jgi:outer membrane protein assembly factor BamB
MPQFMIRRRILVTLTCLLASVSSVAAGEPKLFWPQFLGPRRDGIVRETGLNLDWDAKPPKTLWKVPIGNGFSSTIIVGDRIYTQAKREQMDGVVCFDAADGKELWYHAAVPSYLDKQKHGPGPRSTPVYHHGKLYCLFAMGELLCLTADGKKVWEVDTFKDTGAENPAGQYLYWGVSLSPIIEGDLVIVQPGGNKGNSVAAYHKETGKRVWSAGDDPAGYASPIAITFAGQRQIIMPTGQSILGIEPTKGTVLWRYGFGNKFNATCASPVWADDLLFVSAAYGVGSVVLQLVPPGKDDAKWSVREQWKTKKTMQNLMATSMIVDGHIYGCHGDLSAFFLRCLDLKTGDVKWEKRAQSRYGLLAFEKHILCMSERGDLMLVEAQPRSCEVRGELPNLLKYKTWAMPAFAEGKLYLRDDRHLLCLDLRK